MAREPSRSPVPLDYDRDPERFRLARSVLALLYVLYHLPEPAMALAETRRVLRPGGLVVAATPSRDDSPELAAALRGPPLVELPTRDAVRRYLIGKGVEPSVAGTEAASVEAPVTVTKRGAVVFGRTW